MPNDYLPQGRSFQPLSRLQRAEWNPRYAEEAEFKNLCESIKKRPQLLVRLPLLVADGPIYKGGGVIHDGNHRDRALEFLFAKGWMPPEELQAQGWHRNYAPVDVADVDEHEAQALMLITNNSWARYNEEQVAELVYKLGEAGEDLTVLGFNEKELTALLDSVGALGDHGSGGGGPLEEDDVPAAAQVAVSKPGELWLLGGYTVCPDCGAQNELGAAAAGV